MHKAPVHSPNEFHLNPQGGLERGLNETQYPAVVKPMTPDELAALASREEAVANAESQIEAKKLEALGVIEQERAKLEGERKQLDADKAELAKLRAAANPRPR